MTARAESAPRIGCGSFIAAPGAAAALSELGAGVIEVEPAGADGRGRGLAGLPGTPKGTHDFSRLPGNRNRRGLALDLAEAEGRALPACICRRIVGQAVLPTPVSAAPG